MITKARVLAEPSKLRTKAVGSSQKTRLRSQTLEAAYANLDDLLDALGTTESGLSPSEAAARLAECGLNEVSRERPAPLWLQFLRNFRNPFVALLITLAVISFAVQDREAGTLILIMVSVSVLMRFFQEARSTQSVERLKAMVTTRATVSRNVDGRAERQEVPIKQIAPGDIVHLAAGDMIPAEVRLISARDLFVTQSVLSGESLPVEKFETLGTDLEKRARLTGQELRSPLELPNLCFMGTNVISGTATAVVVATGNDTHFASLTRGFGNERSLTSFDLGINSVSWLFVRFMLLMVPVVLLVNGFTKGNWFEAFLFALSVAVGLTPEMLPVVISANLARGALAMAKHKVIVKRLNSIQNFGAMDILCTDKTGTLTLDRIIMERHLDILGVQAEEVMEYAYLNSYFQTGLINLLDLAVLEYAESHEKLKFAQRYRKVDEIPFDFERRRMSVIVEKERCQHELICKGAVEEVLAVCTRARMEGQTVPLTADLHHRMTQLRDEMSNEGLRVLAVAYRDIDHTHHQYRAADERDLILVGFIAFLDPPKQAVPEALAALRAQGVVVKILTGDGELVARRICKWVSLDVGKVMLGSEISAMDDEELKSAAQQTTLFAKLTPVQKTRVIGALKAAGHTVGYLGDGINDAGALREADVGISVDTAADVAKESADIVMLEKNLMVLAEAVTEGRRTFGNIVKYIKMAASSNFGNVLSVLGSSAFLPFLPMLPVQLLMQNLLYDVSQMAVPFDHVDAEYLSRPRQWNTLGIGRFMLVVGPISSLFDGLTFVLLWFVFGANSPGNQALFQSGWFVEGLLSQTLIVHMIRTQKVPFLQSRPSAALLFATVIIMIIGAALPFTPLGARIGLVPLPLRYLPWLIGILASYFVLTQGVKVWFMRKFGEWL